MNRNDQRATKVFKLLEQAAKTMDTIEVFCRGANEAKALKVALEEALAAACSFASENAEWSEDEDD